MNRVVAQSLAFYHRDIEVHICASTVSVGVSSEQDNEIVECDGCGASVHEGFYVFVYFI